MRDIRKDTAAVRSFAEESENKKAAHCERPWKKLGLNTYFGVVLDAGFGADGSVLAGFRGAVTPVEPAGLVAEGVGAGTPDS
jgi:hypothetical protein